VKGKKKVQLLIGKNYRQAERVLFKKRPFLYLGGGYETHKNPHKTTQKVFFNQSIKLAEDDMSA